MSKQQKHQHKKTSAATTAAKPIGKQTDPGNFMDTMENYFEKNSRFFLLLILGLSVIFSFLCFDTKISTANDDALYIEAGANYAKTFFGYFYTGNAPLYPMLLGVIIKLLGMKLLLLKSFSILFFAWGIYVTFRAFETRIPYAVLIPSMLITAINFPFLMYASLTYSETFSFLVFAWGFYAVNRSLSRFEGDEKISDTQAWYLWAGITFIFFIQMLTRNVALVAIGVLMIYLLYCKHYIGAAITGLVYGFLYAGYKLALKYVWHLDGSQFSYQSDRMFQKNAYNPQMGNEDTWGFVVRFMENAQIYIGQRFLYVLGLKDEVAMMAPSVPGKAAEINASNKLIAIVFTGIVLIALYLMHKHKQRALIFSTLFFGALLGVTFISLQTSWGQSRLIMIYLPFILFTFFYVLYQSGKQYSFMQYGLPVFVFILITSNLTATFKNIKTRFPVFLENISGDPTYGFTPDWQNYIKMSVWCKNNLPDTTMVAVRKPPMSYIFSGGKEFYGIYNTPYMDADSLLTPLRQNKVEYIVVAELRLDPNRYIENQYINTIHRYAYYIIQKYPNAFQFIHQEGEIERAELYKINYAYIDSMKNLQATPLPAIQP